MSVPQYVNRIGDVAKNGGSFTRYGRRTLARGRFLDVVKPALDNLTGGPVAEAAELALIVPSRNTPRIQEVHLTIGHVLCDLVDFILYPEKFA